MFFLCFQDGFSVAHVEDLHSLTHEQLLDWFVVLVSVFSW